MKPTLRTAVTLAVFAAACAVPQAAMAAKRALVVSIDDYRPPVNKLRGAVNDGRTIEKLLQGSFGYRPDEIRHLFDGDATRQGILSTFRSWLIEGTQPGDEVFFYFSGHGSQQPDDNGDEADGLDETLVPVDTTIDGRGRVINMIIDDEIEALLAKLGDRKVTVMVDSCHSGTISRGAFGPTEGERMFRYDGPEGERAAPPSAQAVANHRVEKAFVESTPGRVVWTAVTPHQLALEEVTARPVGGVFTNNFARGIAEKRADANGDGVVTFAELHAYVQKESDIYCKRARCQAGLTPMLEAHRSVLARPVASTGTPPRPQMPAPGPAVQNAATSLLTGGNEAGVSIEILPSSSVRLGQTVRFRVTSRMEGSLVVLDVNAGGQLVQIFPNQFSQKQNKDGRIAGGRSLTIPDPTYGFEFTASEPAGEGQLIALVLQDPVDLGALINQHRDLEPVPAPVDYMAEIAERLRKPWTQGPNNRMIRWSMAGAKYVIAK